MENRKIDLSLEEIHTYAKHMICPSDTIGLSKFDLANIGFDRFRDYRFSELNNKSDITSDVEQLMQTLVSVLKRKLDPNKKAILLLSDGKDSMTLALALSKLGIRCITLTLLRSEDDQLKKFVTNCAQKLGHEPHFIHIDEIFNFYNKEDFLKGCSKMDNPVLDQGFLFFLFGMKAFFSGVEISPKDCQFIDGLGNDEHMGYLPSKSQLNAFKLSKLKIWKLLPNRFNWIKWYIRSPAEAQGDLSALSCFFKFDRAIDINTFFSKIPTKTNNEYIDFRAFSRGSFHDHQCMIGKTKSAALSLGSDIIYPWTDRRISGFCFNLPSHHKYDFSKLKNKVCLRDILCKELGWEQTKRGVDLFLDINENNLKMYLSEFIEPHVYNRILNDGLLPQSVRKRALLELLNLCGYLTSRGYNKMQISRVLIG